MKEARTGDRVRFLNAQGGGIVRRIVGKVAYVEDTDGFEIPTPLKECVVVDEKDSFMPSYKPPKTSEVSTAPNGKMSPDTKPAQKEEIDTLVRPQLRTIAPIRRNDKLNVLLAFVPMDEKQLGQKPYELYLINDSNYTLSFLYSLSEGSGHRLRAAGTIEPNMQIFVEEIAPSEVNELERIRLQLLAYKVNSGFEPKPALSVELRIDGSKFFKLHSFVENDFFDEKALLYNIVKDDLPRHEIGVSPTDLREAMQAKRNSDIQQAKPTRSHSAKPDNQPIEIDLHAHALLDSLAGLQPKDILDYQLKTFRQALEAHKGQKGCRIVFIHGKGEGVLRKAIESELRHKYKNYTYQDASFREYGFGATMVTIH
ncbi:recombination and DNA strand exchange inhibitor protein [Porphyromonas crevioricanis]|uniref:Recombination and DNA strand exchange inhibitor protein n=1 Tax=Porphyromonas crevioricanis TaxID=393921 RepID=A0A2X4PG50_9PORP|nr:DUF2027 domain-containing protein [Porphyromonas crevioricanis]GAD08458.1 putative DNA mismatch repair protein [Porphyromonas crevioricanis JCM 13913]SQH72906.1 recombination and DNA strand exchange inhibitor protein [Porphyromonas crevioricanis]